MSQDGGVCFFRHGSRWSSFSCGRNYSTYVDGVGDAETFPWLGKLFYPIGGYKLTSIVVLVSKQVVVASATDVEKLPKDDFRSRSRVVFGRDCSGPGIKVRDYAFPPDYFPGKPAIAMVQLDSDSIKQDLQIVCQPPLFFTTHPELYVLVPRDCEWGHVLIHKVKWVSTDQCQAYYRQFGDVEEQWPANVVCVQATTQSSCRWREGTALVLKQNGQWSLLGLGMHGPGCGAPARFVDYGAQAHWLRRSVVRTGAPAITRLADNRIIMRRNSANIQKFGACDAEEQQYPLYSDSMTIGMVGAVGQIQYNLTLIHNVEYNCVIIEAHPVIRADESSQPPRISLRRWCAGPPQICYSYQLSEINFFITVDFETVTELKLSAYGQVTKVINVVQAMQYANSFEIYVYIPTFSELAGFNFTKGFKYFKWL